MQKPKQRSNGAFEAARRASAGTGLLAFFALALGCTDLGDAFGSAGKDLFDPDLSKFAAAERLTNAPLTQLDVATDREGHPFVAGLNATGELVIAPFEPGEAVVVGAAREFVELHFEQPVANLETLLAFVEPGEPPTLRFTDLRGRVSGARVPGAGLPHQVLSEGPEGEPGVLVTTHEQRLLFVDPWSDKVGDVLCAAPDAALGEADCGVRFSVFATFNEGSYTIQAEPTGEGEFAPAQLVLRDAQLRELPGGRLGEGVTAFDVAPVVAADAPFREGVVEECTAQGCSDCGVFLCRLRFVALELAEGALAGVAASPRADIEAAKDAEYHRGDSGVYLSHAVPPDSTFLKLQRLWNTSARPVDEPACLAGSGIDQSRPRRLVGNRLTYATLSPDQGGEAASCSMRIPVG